MAFYQKKFKSLSIVCTLIFISLSFSIYAKTNSNAKEIERYDAIVLSNTQIHRLHSKSTGADYKIYINLPASYFNNEKNKSYPTVYLLDADYSFALAKQIAEHLMDRDRINEIIIVGVAYDGPLKYRLNRTRDYTPSKVLDGGYGPEYQKHSGGADKFYQFFKTELIPYIEAKLPTNNNRTIVGHSYGGLFASYGLIRYPEIFDNAIIVSPSLWYDNELVLKKALEKENFNYPTLHNVYLAVGEKENDGNYKMVDELKQFAVTIQGKSHHNVKLFVDIPSGLDHDTIFPTALTKGLVSIFN
jgi:predicted alpha/beta superfamily hydrolase